MGKFYLRYEIGIWLIVFLALISPFVLATYGVISDSYAYYSSTDPMAWMWWYKIIPLLGIWFVCLTFWIVIYMVATLIMKLKSNSVEKKIIDYEKEIDHLNYEVSAFRKALKEQIRNNEETQNNDIEP